MQKIDWTSFDGTSFQKFCNALLLFNISKLAHVFSTAGPDTGIDQLYNGEYGGRKGLWRFQDKFHFSGNKASDIAALKRDIVTDITSNYAGENYLTIITNLNLSVTKYNELMKIGRETLRANGIDTCEFFLWHHATLEGLMSNFPIIHNWFWERESVLLQPFEQYFQNQLREDTTDLRNQLKNKFYGRTSQLVELNQFLVSSDQSTLAVVANGGYGKTKLIIEFLEHTVNRDHEWIPLVMSHTGFTAAGFGYLLRTKRRLLIFIDNAHEIPDVVKDAKRIVDNSAGQHKLIMSTRPTLFSELLQKLPSEGKQMLRLPLSKLSYDETKDMIAGELPGLKEKHIIHLASISKGVPNVVLELIRLIHLGKQPGDITSEAIFTDAVKQIFNEAIRDIHRKTLVPQEKIFDFIRLISLISPVANRQIDRKFISDFLAIREDQLELLMVEFKQLNLMETDYSISIKPDPYSDSILTETIQQNQHFIELVRNYQGAEMYLENILKNLSEADIGDTHKEAFIDSLLSGYVGLISLSDTTAVKIKNIFDFVKRIAVSKPFHALQAVGAFIQIAKQKDHHLQEQFSSWTQKTYFDEVNDMVVEILRLISTYTDAAFDYKDRIHSIIEGYIRSTQNYKVLKACYDFHEWNFNAFGYRTRDCCGRQLYLKTIICGYLIESDDETELRIALESCKFLMEMEFQMEQYFEEATMQLHYGHAEVPFCNHVKEIRRDVTGSLIQFVTRAVLQQLKEEGLEQLLRFIYHCSKNHFKQHKQPLTDEIPVVLKFLSEHLDAGVTITEKIRIRNKLLLFKRTEIREEYAAFLEDLLAKANRNNSLREALQMQLLNSDYFDVRINLEKNVLQLISDYESFDSFKDDLLHLHALMLNERTNFQGILTIIGQHYSAEARSLFSEIQQSYPHSIPAAVMLINKTYKDEIYFYGILTWLWERKVEYLQTFFWLLTWGRNKDLNAYKKTDLDYFEEAIPNDIPDSFAESLSYQLMDYAYIDKNKTFQLLDKHLQRFGTHNLDHLWYILLDKNSAYASDFKDEILQLIKTNREKVDLENATHNGLLDFIETHYGFDKLFEFVEERISAAIPANPYHYFRFERASFLAGTIEQRVQRFSTVLLWFINNYEEGTEKYKYVLELFTPAQAIESEIKQSVEQILGNGLSTIQLERLAIALQVFPNKNEEWINLLCTIVALIIQNTKKAVDCIKLFGSDFHYNTGSKSKTGVGVPYEEDVRRKKILEQIIRDNDFPPLLMSYLKTRLQKVEADISREIESDKREHQW